MTAMPTPESSMSGLHLVGLEELKKRSSWFVGLGILLVVLGTISLCAPVFVTAFSVNLIGWLLIIGGILQTAHAFASKGWSGFFIDLLTGLLYVAAGFMMVANTLQAEVTLTLLIAMFLIVGGVFRIFAAISVRYQNWVWLLLNGAISLVLGISIWQQWPLSGLWVIGLFVGIDMIFNGWSLIMLGMAAKRLAAK